MPGPGTANRLCRDFPSTWRMQFRIPIRQERGLKFRLSHHRWLPWTLSLLLGRRKHVSSVALYSHDPCCIWDKNEHSTYFHELCSRSAQWRKGPFWGRGQTGPAGCLPGSSVWGYSGFPSPAQLWALFNLRANDHFRSSAPNAPLGHPSQSKMGSYDGDI